MKKTQINKINLNLFKLIRKPFIIMCLFLLLGNIAVAPAPKVLDIEQYKMEVYEYATLQLVRQVDSYIKKYADDSKLSAKVLITISDEYNLDLKLMIAQGQLESHFGTRGLAAITNSVFNVGTFDDGTILYTYDDPNESIRPYAQLLKTRYITNSKTENDLVKTKFIDLNGKRYASSLAYEYKLNKIINTMLETTTIDSLILVRYRFKPTIKIQNDDSTREIQQSYRIYSEGWNTKLSEVVRIGY